MEKNNPQKDQHRTDNQYPINEALVDIIEDVFMRLRRWGKKHK